MLGLGDRGRVVDLFEHLMKGDAAAALAEFRSQYDAGADPATLNVVEVEDLPISYLPGNSLRTRVRVVGDVTSHRSR